MSESCNLGQRCRHSNLRRNPSEAQAKEYFANYFLHTSDVTFAMAKNEMQVHQQYAERWKVTLVDTGDDTQTGGRLKRVASYLVNEDIDVGANDAYFAHEKQS